MLSVLVIFSAEKIPGKYSLKKIRFLILDDCEVVLYRMSYQTIKGFFVGLR